MSRVKLACKWCLTFHKREVAYLPHPPPKKKLSMAIAGKSNHFSKENDSTHSNGGLSGLPY